MQATEDCGRGVTGEGPGHGGLLKAKVGLEPGPLSPSSASSGCKHHPYNRVHVSISITISGHLARGMFLTKGFPEFYYQGHVFAPFSQGLQPAQLQIRRSRESVVVCCCGLISLSSLFLVSLSPFSSGPTSLLVSGPHPTKPWVRKSPKGEDVGQRPAHLPRTPSIRRVGSSVQVAIHLLGFRQGYNRGVRA